MPGLEQELEQVPLAHPLVQVAIGLPSRAFLSLGSALPVAPEDQSFQRWLHRVEFGGPPTGSVSPVFEIDSRPHLIPRTAAIRRFPQEFFHVLAPDF